MGLPIGSKSHTTCGISLELLAHVSAAKYWRPFSSLQALNNAFVRALNNTFVVGIMITPIAVHRQMKHYMCMSASYKDKEIRRKQSTMRSHSLLSHNSAIEIEKQFQLLLFLGGKMFGLDKVAIFIVLIIPRK